MLEHTLSRYFCGIALQSLSLSLCLLSFVYGHLLRHYLAPIRSLKATLVGCLEISCIPISKLLIPRLISKFRAFSVILYLLRCMQPRCVLFPSLCTSQANVSLILLLAIIGKAFYIRTIAAYSQFRLMIYFIHFFVLSTLPPSVLLFSRGVCGLLPYKEMEI